MLLFARNVSVESGKEDAVRTFIGLMLMVGTGLTLVLSGSGPINAIAEQSVVSPNDPSKPLYIPPKKYAPRARVGGELRGTTDGSDPDIAALVPDHVALTAKKTPSLNWYLSKPTKHEIRFTFVDSRIIKPMYEAPISTPREAGIYTINLKDLGLNLESDVQYRWYISMVGDPLSPSTDKVAGGVIERCDLSACFDPILTCDNQQNVLDNARRGFWYDAMSCLCSLIDKNPGDPGLRRIRAHLLKDVGLHEVAEWDLRSIQSALH